MPNPRSVRSSQRSVLACTNCARRKVKCSKAIPCTACVRQNKADQCQREPVVVVSRRSAARSRASTSQTDTVAEPPNVPEPENNGLAAVSTTWAQDVPPTVIPAISSTTASSDSALAQINGQMLEQLFASLTAPDTRLTNEAAAMLEFLTHGRRNILNRFIGRDSALPSATQLAQKWDTFLPREDARRLLLLHESHLTWMHNAVHMPTFLREFEKNVLNLECDRSWIALYYAILSHTLHHLDCSFLSTLPQQITVDANASRDLFDKSIELLYRAEFMDKHRLTSVQTICLLVQVAHNLDKSDLICVLVSTGIRIAQCLNLHRLGPDDPSPVGRQGDHEVIDREIPFQNTCQIHYSQFNTPIPLNCHSDQERMINYGRVNAQPAEVSTIMIWTNCLAQLSVLMWNHHDRMSRLATTERSADNIQARYDEVIRADEEIKSLYLSWPETLRDVSTMPSDSPAMDGLPAGLMPAMLLMSIAQKFTVSSNCHVFVIGGLHSPSCSITLLFALLFMAQNALTYDLDKLRRYVEFGKEFLSKEQHASSIARRGVRLLSALVNLERSSEYSVDIEADIGEAIRSVALADDDGAEANPLEGYQMAFPYGQDLWESLMRGPFTSELL
ncbi:hypothetical protein FBEOM_4016 [Fusarium beomiforme]|uniref:Zn(2)-C6 fungal-type domain-containing protein n=1 Tax=Fusarium beomiforme TaxID=44412 RepID=A0A9P5E0D1_9HYPO|nr:hypothetical protein FBEOM_4016 [Fusarium beomiforme]